MLQIGHYNTLKIEKFVDFGLYLISGSDEILLPSKYVPEGVKEGDSIEVFIYTDSEDRLIATTLKPYAVVGDFAYLEVKDINKYGAFLDWGLEKDLFVPFREQPFKLYVGKHYVFKVCLDEKTNRIYASASIDTHVEHAPGDLSEGQQVDLLIYKFTDTGVMAVINDSCCGMLYKNEVFEKLGVGDRKTGFIKKIRDDDKIDLFLRKPGYESVKDSKNVVMQKIREAGGHLPYHDKSSPEDIKNNLGMSKKEFKRVIGGLYREGVIKLSESGITLTGK